LALGEVVSSSSFRLAISFATAFVISTLLLFAFIYWQTAIVEIERIDSELAHDARLMAEQDPGGLLESVRVRVAYDIHRVTSAAVFAADGSKIAGNLDRLPERVAVDGGAHHADMAMSANGQAAVEILSIVCRRLADGRVLVVGRSIDSLANLRRVVMHALELGVIPAVLLALVAGALLGHRAQARIKAVQRAAERIMLGNLRERLPVTGKGHDFDRIASGVNFMLDEIERLLDHAKSTGDNIAHDLRTPLTRVRSRLERARLTAKTQADLQDSVDRAIGGLDQALRVVTAVLRIGQIERGHRRGNFASVDLYSLVEEIADLFEPIAEEKGIRLSVEAGGSAIVHGDRDLLSEAIANLVDNAVKFTPAGGTVVVGLVSTGDQPLIRVVDSGPGIPPEEREAVMHRFYRSDKSRHIDGCGLGLSLVEAIVTLHGFKVAIGDAEQGGCVFEILCTAEADHGHRGGDAHGPP